MINYVLIMLLITGNQATKVYLMSEKSLQIVYFRNYRTICSNTPISLNTHIQRDELHIYCNNIEFIGNDTQKAQRNPRFNSTPSNKLVILHDFNSNLMRFNSVEGFGKNPTILRFECVDDSLKININSDIKKQKLVVVMNLVGHFNNTNAELTFPNRLVYGRKSKLPGAGSKGSGNPKKRITISKQNLQHHKSHKIHTKKSNSKG